MKKKTVSKKNNRTKKSAGNKKPLTWEEIAEIGFQIALLREIVEEKFELAEQQLRVALFKACEPKKGKK